MIEFILPKATVICTVGLPLAAFCIVIVNALIFKKPSEGFINRLIAAVMILSWTCSMFMAVALVRSDADYMIADFGSWYSLGHYHFPIQFLFNSLSVPILIVANFLI